MYAKTLGIEGVQQWTGPGDVKLPDASKSNRNQ